MKRITPLLFILLFSCKEKYPPVPKDIIQTKPMELILSDMLIADALSETRAWVPLAKNNTRKNIMQRFLKTTT